MRFYKIETNYLGNPAWFHCEEIKTIKILKYKGKVFCYFKKNSTQYNGYIVCKDSHIIRSGYFASGFWDGLRNLFGLPKKIQKGNLPF
jgi:hypothetical protein